MLRRGPGLQDTAPFQLPQNLLMSFLLSEWILGWSPSPSRSHAPSSDELAISACGEVSYLLLPGCNLFVGIKQLVNLPSSCRFLILLFQRGWENNDGF